MESFSNSTIYATCKSSTLHYLKESIKMFGFSKSHVEKAAQDLEKAIASLEAAVVKETTHLINFEETKDKVIAKTTEIQRVIKEDYERLVAAETARFEAVKAKIEDRLTIHNDAITKGKDILAKIKSAL